MANTLALWASILAVLLTVATLRLYAILPRPGDRTTRRHKRARDATCKLSVFLGSGGHTSESLAMISGLDFNRYKPRVYYVSEGDTLSAHKAIALEQAKNAAGSKGSNEVTSSHSRSSTSSSITIPRPDVDDLPYRIVVIPRARRVHQSLLTTPATALVSLLSCIYLVSVESILQRNKYASIPKTGKLATTTTAPTVGQIENSVLVLNGPGTCLMLAAAVYINKFFAMPAPKIIYIESFARVHSLSLSGKLIWPLVDRFIVQWPQLLENVKAAECYGWLV